MKLVLGTFVLLIWTSHTATADNSGDLDPMEGLETDEDIFKRARIPKFIGKRTYELPEEDTLSSDSFSADASDVDRLNSLAFLLKNYRGNSFDINDDLYDNFRREARYIPKLVGRSSNDHSLIDPNPIGKRRSPLFVGRRRAPLFVGKRLIHLVGRAPSARAPKFVGKRAHPVLIGRRRESTNSPENPVYSYVMLRRFVPYNENLMPFLKSDSASSSIALDNLSAAADRMVSGRYIPWNALANNYSSLISRSQEKRFVTPQFIGKRVQNKPSNFGRYDGPRVYGEIETIKRFDAPMFVGRRSSDVIQEHGFLDNIEPVTQYIVRKRRSAIYGDTGRHNAINDSIAESSLTSALRLSMGELSKRDEDFSTASGHHVLGLPDYIDSLFMPDQYILEEKYKKMYVDKLSRYLNEATVDNGFFGENPISTEESMDPIKDAKPYSEILKKRSLEFLGKRMLRLLDKRYSGFLTDKHKTEFPVGKRNEWIGKRSAEWLG